MSDEIDARLLREKVKVPEHLETQMAEMRGYRATYLQIVDKARAAGTLDPTVALRALDRFDALEQDLLEAKTEAARDNIVERAEEVEQSRAYLQPESEIVVEATTLFADMKDWGVPTAVLDGIQADLLTVIKSTDKDVADKRAALNKLYAYYDAWSDHVANYESWATRTAWALGALLVASAVGCIMAIVERKPLHGFMVAGLTGALLSVLGKFPPMLGWGQWASYTPRMLGRITTGIVTTLAGGALLALDVIQIGEKSFTGLFSAKPEPKEMLLLIGLGIVFGFSERALVQFEDLVFKSNTQTPKGKEGAT